jgi:hypothetical protein
MAVQFQPDESISFASGSPIVAAPASGFFSSLRLTYVHRLGYV